MISFSLSKWIQSLSMTSFIISTKFQVKRKKFLQKLQYMDAAGPDEFF